MTALNPDLIAGLAFLVRDELAHHVIGGGYYQTSISLDEAGELAQIALEAAAPFIAGHVLRDAAEAFGENQMIREGDVKEWLRARACDYETENRND